MNNERYEQLENTINYMNEEGFVPEGKQLMVFRNTDELIEAIRQNHIPNIVWTKDDEKKWVESEETIKSLKRSYNA